MRDRLKCPPGQPAPQIKDERIWVDGCWDFFHHGHAGALLQAKQFGDELYVGVHSDESIKKNKGPTVMTEDERLMAVDACKWVTHTIRDAPYVTSLAWITHFGCKYVVHGDDITSDSSGQDCYRFVKATGRFKVVKRTPSISTTDLIRRILECTRTHFIKSLNQIIEDDGNDCPPNEGIKIKKLIEAYATNDSGVCRGTSVWSWKSAVENQEDKISTSEGKFISLSPHIYPQHDQRVIYVDGSFDLFSAGHIKFIKLVIEKEKEMAESRNWNDDMARRRRFSRAGCDYNPSYIVAGVHDDDSINKWKGQNYPIMNILERGLCVTQCKYIDAVIFGAPFILTHTFLKSIPVGVPCAVYHGSSISKPLPFDPYSIPKEMGIYHEIGTHFYSDVNATQICQRILNSRDLYEERQRIKGIKSMDEELLNK